MDQNIHIQQHIQRIYISTFFIGTYTSNVSRIVPLYVGFEKSLSLDDEWKL